MTWALIADSSCNLREYRPTAPDCIYAVAPLKIEVAGRSSSMTRRSMSRSSTVASPRRARRRAVRARSAGEWADLFRGADNVIAVTISSNLSGSFDAAEMGRNLVMDEYAREHDGQIAGKNIYVLDSHAAGGKLELIIELLDRYLTNNPDCTFDEAVAYADRLAAHSQVQYSLSSYDNLTKNGRMPKLVGGVSERAFDSHARNRECAGHDQGGGADAR